MKFVAGLAALAVTTVASAGIVGFVGDTTLEGGWYAFEDEFGVSMTEIYSDAGVYADITSIDVPEFGGTIDFPAHSVRQIGSGWATWSHGYTGQVFYNNGLFDCTYELNMSGAYAFDAYLEPNPFSLQTFTATAHGSAGGSVSVEFSANGSAGANHFGFYASGETIVSIDISGTSDWAIGEWRVGTPAPGALALFGLAALRRRRR